MAVLPQLAGIYILNSKKGLEREANRYVVAEVSKIRETRIAITTIPMGFRPPTSIFQEITDHDCQVMLALMAETTIITTATSHSQPQVTGSFTNSTIHYANQPIFKNITSPSKASHTLNSPSFHQHPIVYKNPKIPKIEQSVKTPIKQNSEIINLTLNYSIKNQ